MSVRREVFARVGGFAEDLGRIGRNPLGCEETEFCIRVRQIYRRMGRGARIVFEPTAQVDHRVSDDRVRWAYLRRRSWSEGLSKAAVSRLVGSDDALSTERTYVATVLPGAVVRELRAGRPASALAIATALGATAAGYLRGRLPGATSAVRLPAADAASASVTRPLPRATCPRRAGPAVPEQAPRWHGDRPPDPPHRRVTSFVHQRNRFTEGQAHAWERLWPLYGIDVADVVSGAVAYDPPAWFGRRAPLVLEIGSGTGESTAAQAAAAPDTDHLAVEVFEPGLAQLLMRIEDAALTNLRLLRGDAVDLLRERVPPGSPGRGADLLPRPVAETAAPQAPPGAARVRRARRLPAGSGRGPAPRHGLGPLRRPDAGGCAGEPLLENTSTGADGWTCARPRRPETKFERRARQRRP